MTEPQEKDESTPEKTLPYIPVKVNGLAVEDLAPAELYETPVNRPQIGSGGIPLESTLKDVPKEPGFLSQIGHELWKMNRLAQQGEYLYDALTEPSTVDPVPENWTPMTEEAIQDFPDKYWDYIIHAKSPNDQKARQDRSRQQMEDDERFSHGSWMTSLAGGALGIFSDPYTYLLPLSVGGKYASIAQNVFVSMAKNAPAMAIDSVSRNLMIQSNRVGDNIQDFATDSLRDFMFGTALVGLGGAVGGGLREAKLWNTRKFFNFGADGINVSPVVNEEGIIIKEMEARPMRGASVSAAKVDAANFYINETMAMGGLFNVPVVGKSITKFLGSGFLASPVMYAMSSKSLPLKSFFNRLVPHGVITTGEAHIARQFTAVEYAQLYEDEAKSLAQFIRTKTLEANGLQGGPNVKNSIKNFVQARNNVQTITDEQFGIEVRNVATIEGYKSKFKEVHEVADQVVGFFEKMGIDYHDAVGQGNIFLNPRNAIKYMPQNWNIPKMLNEEGEWKALTLARLSEQQELIQQLQAPIFETEALINSLKSQLEKVSDKASAAYKSLQSQIKESQRILSRHENQLNTKLLENEDYHILLEDRVLLTEQERAQLNSILEPLRLAESHKIVIEAKLRPLEKEKKAQAQNELVNEKLQVVRDELEDAENAILRERDELQRKARNDEIDRKFFNREGDEYKFLNPNKKPQFRRLLTKGDLELHVNQAFDSILNQSPDDLIQGVFGSLEPGIIERPSYLKERTLLFDTTEHNNLGFLDPDVSKSIASYANNLGKIIGFKKALPEFSETKGIDGVLGFFHDDYTKRRAEINAEPKSDKRTKKLNQLKKEYEKDVKFMNDTWKVYMGTYSSKNSELHRWSNSLKNLVASSKLGAVPIYQLAELGAIIMKQGVMPFLAQGLRPMVKTLNGHLKGVEAEERRLNAASAHIALWGTRNGYAQKLINSNRMSYAPTSSVAQKVGVASDNLSHVSGNLFGINYIANANETLAANIFQSDVMQAAFAHQAGKLTKKQILKMNHYGIDIQKMSKRFTENYKKAEGFEISGGYYSKYYKWEDLDASNIMSMAMRRMVKDTIVNGERFNSPYWAQDPIFSMVFMFHGWAYSALTHYAVPLMQRPDAEHILGMLMVVGLSLAAEPLKRLANGKEAYDNDAKWFEEAYKAVDYSGLLGPYAQWFQDINTAMGGALLPNLIAEKYKNRPRSGGAGPVAGYLSDLLSTTGHGIIGDWTEGDVKRFERLLPLSSLIPLRSVANTWIESMNLPKTRKDANSWAYRHALFGEGQ